MTGATGDLNLESAGLLPDNRGRVSVDNNYCTEVDNIYASDDVIGFPSLASTSMEQGRLASCHAFGESASSFAELFPYSIYTIPEISVAGANEEELTSRGVPYEVGKAFYREIARGQIIGDHTKNSVPYRNPRSAWRQYSGRRRVRTDSYRTGCHGA